MPKRSDDYMRERRHHILAALTACTRRQGWDGTTIDDVALEAGLSKGAVYVHFESKRALLAGLLDQEAAALLSLDGIDSLDAFRSHLKRVVAPLNQPDGWRLATALKEVQVAAAYDPELRPRLVGLSAKMVDAVTAIVIRLRPTIPFADARLRALSFTMLVDGLIASRSFGDGITESNMEAILEIQLQTLVAA